MEQKRVLINKDFKDWVQNPVCEVLKQVIQAELDEAYQERANCFIPGDAERTHEVRSNLLGLEGGLADVLGLLNADPELMDSYFVAHGVHIVKTQQEEDEENYEE